MSPWPGSGQEHHLRTASYHLTSCSGQEPGAASRIAALLPQPLPASACLAALPTAGQYLSASSASWLRLSTGLG